MSGRRIRLDLSDFVLDIGSQRWMFLSDAKFSTVSDLVEQLKNEYNQLEEEDMVQLFMDGEFTIPPWETIEILQSGDLVKVVRTKINGEKKRKMDKSTNDKKRNQELNNANKNIIKKSNKKIKTVNVEETKSSSSSDSDIAEDITSKVAVVTEKKVTQTKVPGEKKKVVSSSSDSSDSSSDDEPEMKMNKKSKLDNKVVNKSVSCLPIPNSPVTKVVTKKSNKSSSSDTTSSSDSSSDESNKVKTMPNVIPPDASSRSEKEKENAKENETGSANVSDKPKRKRKRKNKNKNKLAADQMNSFGSEIVPTEAAIRQISNTEASNNHVRFDDVHEASESMDVDQADVEEFTADQIRQLYSQSVPSAKVINGSGNNDNSNCTGSNTSYNQAISRNGTSSKHGKPLPPSKIKENPKTISSIPEKSVSCEDALMKQFDGKIVNNASIVNKPGPKIVFTPRVLNLKEMKKDSPKNLNLQFSNQSQSQGPDLSQFSALLNCKDALFNKNLDTGLKPPMEKAVVMNKDYTAYHAVSDSGPRVGDVIAFKVVEMGENYAPEVSDYKEGKVLECDGTNTVTFELLWVTKKMMAGKFEIDDVNEQDEKVVTFNWPELLEPRLMFP